MESNIQLSRGMYVPLREWQGRGKYLLTEKLLIYYFDTRSNAKYVRARAPMDAWLEWLVVQFKL